MAKDPTIAWVQINDRRRRHGSMGPCARRDRARGRIEARPGGFIKRMSMRSINVPRPRRGVDENRLSLYARRCRMADRWARTAERT
jgi:hypothetical protein